MMGKRIKRISDAIFGADQPTIDKWFADIDREVALAEKQESVKTKIFQAVDKGIEVKKLEEITGIPRRTIYCWLRKRKKKKDYVKEAMDLKQATEEKQDASQRETER